MYKKFLGIAIACLSVFLFSCEEKPKTPEIRPGEVTVITDETQADGASDQISIQDERITITSLLHWNEFNHDGNFSDNCLQFLRNFIENDSEFFEFNTVQVDNWEIIRDPEVYGLALAFNFTVTASELDTIPVGAYQTIVNDEVDCEMVFVESPRTSTETEAPSTAATETVSYWLMHAMYYDYFDFGAWKNNCFGHYLCVRYCDETDKLLFSDFAAHAKDKFGMTVTEENLPSNARLYIEDKHLYIYVGSGNFTPSFDILDVTEDGTISTVTVQLYADCNKFLPSYKMAYRIENGERFLSCEILNSSPYKPYGLHSVYGN